MLTMGILRGRKFQNKNQMPKSFLLMQKHMTKISVLASAEWIYAKLRTFLITEKVQKLESSNFARY